jgi:NADH dehydrogenase/NADH:ubiquinone oxidoreductase subunit G
MADFVEGWIDGQNIRVAKDTTILSAARLLGRAIPTLCHHDGLPGDGNCRLCQVQLNGRLVAACLYPLRENGFTVETDNAAIRRARAFVLEMLTDRCPASPRLLALACEYGVVPDERFQGDGDLCIRCGRCVRACESVGKSAIGFAGRGAGRQVAGPFFEPPEECLGCLACASVCPTGKIKFTEARGRRAVWGRDFELITCRRCGRSYATEDQVTDSFDNICEECRRRQTAKSLKAALHYQSYVRGIKR